MRKYILKHSTSKQRELKYDFLPELLEIIEKPCGKGASAMIWLLFLLLMTAVLWAALFKLDIVVTSSGVVEPAGDMKLVQSPMSGMVEKILVNEGDFVRKGESILILSQDISQTDMARVEYSLGLARVQREVYEQIYDGMELEDIETKDYGGLQWVAGCIIQEEKIYRKDREGLKLQTSLPGDKELYDFQLERASMQRELEIMEKISSCGTKIKEYEAELEKYRFSLENAAIKAPVDGYVAQLGVNTPGQSVTAAQAVASMVPSDTELIFQCRLPDKDIADIREGQKVNMKLKAYPYSDYGTIEGTITYISPAGQPTEDIGYVYAVHIAMENKNKRIELIPGMTGTAEVVCGHRSVLEYFLEPVSKGIGDSMKEK